MISESTLFKFLYGLDIGVRVLVLPIILYFPLWGWLIIFLLDTFDYALALRANINFKRYQIIDKSLDLLNMFYLIMVSFWFGNVIFSLFCSLFLLRCTGHILYMITKKDVYLLIFPNFIEFLFPLYLLSTSLQISIFGTLLLKIPHEFLLHKMHWIDPISKKYLRKHPSLRS